MSDLLFLVLAAALFYGSVWVVWRIEPGARSR